MSQPSPEENASQTLQAGEAVLDEAVGVLGTFENLFDTAVRVFSRIDALAHPADLATSLERLKPQWAAVMIVVGLASMVLGAKHYRIATVSLMLAVGATLGFWIGATVEAPRLLLAGCFGALLAAVAFPLMKYAVAVLGGMTGAFLGANAWAAGAGVFSRVQGAADAAGPNGQVWIGALIGLVVCGLLAFVVFRVSVAVFTSVGGATLTVLGVMALVVGISGDGAGVAARLGDSSLVIPILVLVPAVIGLIVQERITLRQQRQAKPSG